MSVRTFTRSRVSEHDLSITRNHTLVGEGYDDRGWWCEREVIPKEKKIEQYVFYIVLFYAFKNKGIYYETDFKIFSRYEDFYQFNSCFLLESKGIQLNQQTSHIFLRILFSHFVLQMYWCVSRLDSDDDMRWNASV